MIYEDELKNFKWKKKQRKNISDSIIENTYLHDWDKRMCEVCDKQSALDHSNN